MYLIGAKLACVEIGKAGKPDRSLLSWASLLISICGQVVYLWWRHGSVVGSRTVMSTGRLAKNYLGLIRKSR